MITNMVENRMINKIEKTEKKEEEVMRVDGNRRLYGKGQAEPKKIKVKQIDFKKCMSIARVLDSGNVPVTIENVLLIKNDEDRKQYKPQELKRLQNKLSARYSKEQRQGEYYQCVDRGAYLSVTTLYR